MIFRWVCLQRACATAAAAHRRSVDVLQSTRGRSASQARARVRCSCAAGLSTFAARAAPPTAARKVALNAFVGRACRCRDASCGSGRAPAFAGQAAASALPACMWHCSGNVRLRLLSCQVRTRARRRREAPVQHIGRNAPPADAWPDACALVSARSLAPSDDFLRLTRERGASEASLQTSVVTLECRTPDGCVVRGALGGVHSARARPLTSATLQCHGAPACGSCQRCARGRRSILQRVAGAAQHIRPGPI